MSQLTLKQREAFKRTNYEDISLRAGIADKNRAKLETLYIGITLEYLEEATDAFHTFSEVDLRDKRFNLYHAIHLYPRLTTLADIESPSGRAHKKVTRELYKNVLLAHLGLLAGKTVDEENIETPRRQLCPSIIYADLLRHAGVFTDGVHTESIDSSTLQSLVTTTGERFTQEFVASSLPYDPFGRNHLELVA